MCAARRQRPRRGDRGRARRQRQRLRRGLTASTDLAAGQAGPPGGDTDVFVARFDPTAQTLPCVTYFGGSSADEVRGLVKREFMGFVIVK